MKGEMTTGSTPGLSAWPSALSMGACPTPQPRPSHGHRLTPEKVGIRLPLCGRMW